MCGKFKPHLPAVLKQGSLSEEELSGGQMLIWLQSECQCRPHELTTNSHQKLISQT